MTITVTRRGYQGGTNTEIQGRFGRPSWGWYSCVGITFTMPSAGGGRSEFGVEISSESFIALAEQMIRTDREAAIRAFGEALLIPPSDDEEAS